METIVWLGRWCAWPFVLLLRLERENGEHNNALLMVGIFLGMLFLVIGAASIIGASFPFIDKAENMKVFLGSIVGYYLCGLLFSIRKKVRKSKQRYRKRYL